MKSNEELHISGNNHYNNKILHNVNPYVTLCACYFLVFLAVID